MSTMSYHVMVGPKQNLKGAELLVTDATETTALLVRGPVHWRRHGGTAAFRLHRRLAVTRKPGGYKRGKRQGRGESRSGSDTHVNHVRPCHGWTHVRASALLVSVTGSDARFATHRSPPSSIIDPSSRPCCSLVVLVCRCKSPRAWASQCADETTETWPCRHLMMQGILLLPRKPIASKGMPVTVSCELLSRIPHWPY